MRLFNKLDNPRRIIMGVGILCLVLAGLCPINGVNDVDDQFFVFKLILSPQWVLSEGTSSYSVYSIDPVRTGLVCLVIVLITLAVMVLHGLNRPRRIIMHTGIGLVVLAGLFPVCSVDGKASVPRFILLQKWALPEGASCLSLYTIDPARTGLVILAVVLITVVAVILCPASRGADGGKST
jgi:hypothetical protein